MIVVGIESSTESVGVALVDGEESKGSVTVSGRRRHGESLVPALEHLLTQCGLSVNQIEGVGVDVGPGLFTGLRVGVATAKGLAMGLSVPVVALTSGELLAEGARAGGWRGMVVTLIDARRGEVFGGVWDAGPEGVEELSATARYPTDDVAQELVERARREPMRVFVAGDGMGFAGTVLAGLEGTVRGGTMMEHPSAVTVGVMASRKLGGDDAGAGGSVVPTDALVPIYMRDADVRINWAQRREAGIP